MPFYFFPGIGGFEFFCVFGMSSGGKKEVAARKEHDDQKPPPVATDRSLVSAKCFDIHYMGSGVPSTKTGYAASLAVVLQKPRKTRLLPACEPIVYMKLATTTRTARFLYRE